MPKEIVPGLRDYGDDDGAAPPKQTVFPKAQGGVSQPSPAGAASEIVPGLKDYGDGKTVAAPDQGDDSISWYNVFHPKPADLSRPQTWTDWMTKTYSPAASDIGRASLDDVSFGFADPIRAKLTGENVSDLRARTADAQAAMGPMGPVVNALTYAVPGSVVGKGLEAAGAAGKVAGAVGRYGAGALEGGAANATSSVGHQINDPNGIDALKVAKDAALGAGVGVGGQAVGDVAAAVVRNVSNYVRGSPGRGGEQWDWRTRAAAGDPTLQGDVAISQATLPPDHPAQPALAKTQGALAQSTDPGNIAHAATGLGAWYTAKLAGGDELAQLAAGGISPFASKYFVNKPAQMLNTADRNINVGQSLDQLYPALYGRQSTPALDTSGWADAIRQFAIGSERPGPPGSQFW